MCLLQSFREEQILLLTQDFCVCGLHSSTTQKPRNVGLLLSSNSEQFFQDITSPCLLQRGPLCQPPRGVPGSWLHTKSEPTQKNQRSPLSEEAALVGARTSLSNQAPHQMQYALEYISSVTLRDLCWHGPLMTYSGFTSVEKVEVSDGCALL